MADEVQFISKEKKQELEIELNNLKFKKIPELAKRIDDARQLGDLSENAEYHAAREEMAWTQSRISQINKVLDSAEILNSAFGGVIRIGSTIVVESKGKKKEYAIVGAQEANPMIGKISNESPLGKAFLGKKVGDTVDVEIPSGKQVFVVLEIK